MLSNIISSILPHLPEKLVWQFSKKYIAGSSLNQAISVSKKLNEKGIEITVDLLGEFIENIEQAEYFKNEYIKIINSFEKEHVRGKYSLKPSSFGLLIDEEQCYRNIKEIVSLAHKYNNFVRIDMEDSKCVDLEITLYRRLKKDFPNNVGLVLQAYLHRSNNDIDILLQEHSSESPLNFRLCKGIYVESEDVAIQNPDMINTNFLKLLDKLMKNKVYVGIATHDEVLIEGAKKIIEKYNVPNDRYEFQMLYGVTTHLRDKIVEDGKAMRVYVPYGKDWFKYSVRRLKENPKMTSHIIKSLFS